MAEERKNLQTTQVIAKLFGVSTRRVEQLKTEGVIKGQGKPTKYDLLPTIQAYIKYLSDKAYGREEKRANIDSEKRKLEADARIKEAKAEMNELELKELKGELHRAKDVEAIMTDHVLEVRSMLLGLPGRCATDVAAVSEPAEASNIIKREVNNILQALSEYRYDPEEYAERVRERIGWDGDDEEDE